LQDRVVTDVMAALEVKIDSSAMERIAPPETLHLEAYEEYAQGRQQFHTIGKESLERARQHLERAVALDPNYALAYAALGATHAMRYIHRTDPADLDYAVRYSERAIELDHEIGEPYTWLGYAYMRQGKIDQSLRAGRQGVERQPDLVLAHYFLGAAYMVATESSPHGYQPAVKHLLDATVTDPRWVASWLCLGQLATMCGEYDHAQQYLLRGLELQRRGPGFGYFIGPEMVLATVTQRQGHIGKAREIYASAAASFESCDHVYREAMLALTACGLGDLLRREGHLEAAWVEFRRAARLVKEYPRMLGRQRVLARTLAGMSAVHAAQGDSQRAGELLEQVASLLMEIGRAPQSWIWEGFIGQLYYAAGAAYARLGKPETALDYLEKAVASGWRDAHCPAFDPELAALRSQSRFQVLLEDLRLLPALEFRPSASLSAA